jgi:signal transduction histidine kinase
VTILTRVGTGEQHGSRVPALPGTALWLAAYVLASLLGRIVVVGPDHVGLVWPAAGVGLAWLASSRRGLLMLDVALMSAATMAVLAVTEGGTARTILSLSVVAQTLLALWLLHRLVPGIWGTGGRVPFTRLRQFGMILVSVILAALVTSVLRWLVGAVVLDDEHLGMLIGRFGRQASAMATIGVFGLLLGGWLTERRDRGLPVFGPITRPEVVHLVGIEVVTALIFVGFWRNPEIPTTYFLSLTVVWAALRFNPVVTATHCLLTGIVTVWMTIEGHGPIANVNAADTRALLAQLFVVVLMVTGMTISLIRRQISDTIRSLEQSEAALGLRAHELDMVMSHLDDGVAIIEETGRVVHANLALRTAFGTKPLNTADRIFEPGEEESPLYYPDGRIVAAEGNPFVRALSGESVDAEEFHHPEDDGSVRVLEISAFQVPNGAGAPRRVMVVVRDVTTATTHRESLVSFAGTVAHDLNNPLSVIDGWAEALEEDLTASDSSEAARALPMVQHIRASVEQARGFISALLAHSVSRDQALECEPISLRNLVKHIAGTRDRPRNGGEIVTGDLLDAWADRMLLRQVLDNLIGNAFKYVAPGTTPRVLIEAEDLGDGWAKVMVRDNGIGVPLLQRERVFESFHRATEGYQGTGLGLAICKRIIQRHGGNIRVTANPDGVGSCFEFTLPMTPEALQRSAAGTAGGAP